MTIRPKKSPEPPAVGVVSSAVASLKPRGATHLYGVHVRSRRCLSSFRQAALDREFC